MGYDAACTIRIDGQIARGTAWLEHKDLVFRGPFRVAASLCRDYPRDAAGGTLIVGSMARRCELDVGGRNAERWAGGSRTLRHGSTSWGSKPACGSRS